MEFDGGAAIFSTGEVRLTTSELRDQAGGSALKLSSSAVGAMVDTTFSDKVGTAGGAVQLYWGALATPTGGALLDNSGTVQDGGVFFRANPGDTLELIGVDVGTATASDVILFPTGGPGAGFDYTGIVTVQCDAGGCQN